MESNQHDIVGEQHESSELVSDSAFSKSVISEVADVLDLGVLHDVFVHCHRRDPEENASTKHCEDTWHPSENPGKELDSLLHVLKLMAKNLRERPRLSHDCKAHLVTCKKPSGFLPAHRPEFDVMLMVFVESAYIVRIQPPRPFNPYLQ